LKFNPNKSQHKKKKKYNDTFFDVFHLTFVLMFRRALAATCGLIAGIGTVVAGTQMVHQFNPPEYSSKGNRFDLSTFQGRYFKMLLACDPSTLLFDEKAIRSSESLLTQYENGQVESDRRTLWSARALKESAVHPDTGDIVPLPFRMSGFVPFNGPVCVSMMLAKSTPTLLFWNWVNQSQNALVNYFNRNASSPTSNTTLVVSYCGAVGAALSVAFLLSQFVNRRFSPSVAKNLMKFIAFPASIVASSSNCYIMRRPEIEKGITLIDSEGQVLANEARSSIAAAKAVKETVLSRVALQVPCYFVPALIMSIPAIIRLGHRSASLSLCLYTYVSIVSFGFGLPATVAIFPQTGSIRVSDLESNFQNLHNSQGQKIEIAYYNKGL
jgi:sideroflexin-5